MPGALFYCTKRCFCANKTQITVYALVRNIFSMKSKKTRSIQLLIGTSLYGKRRGVSIMSVGYNGRFMRLPVNSYESDSAMTHHRLVLLSLLAFLRANALHDVRLEVFTSNDEAAFEWMTEYKEDGVFSEQTLDRDLWCVIARIVSGAQIELAVYGSDSALSDAAQALRCSRSGTEGKGKHNNGK